MVVGVRIQSHAHATPTRRRLLIGGAALAAASPSSAQQKAVPVIGFLASSSAERSAGRLAAFRQGLREIGYQDGRSIVVEQRYADGKVETLPHLAAELIGFKVDILVTEGTPAAAAAKKATTSIPVVFGNAGDPVGSGLVASLARPGGNVTGLSDFSTSLVTKRLELLKEVAPAATSVAFLLNLRNPSNLLELKYLREAAETFGLKLVPVEIAEARDLGPAEAAIARERPGALAVAGDPTLGLNQPWILELAAQRRLPALYPSKLFAAAGGLMSFGTNFDDLFRRAATFVHKILQDAKPADLPVEQPTKFELVVNLKTAKALGLTIPPSILARADELIE
jgi:putative ABC transport system substrate-binding protein